MKIKGWQVIRTPARKREKFNTKIGIIQNGEDNAYPTRMEYFVNNSTTAKACANTYMRFLIGKGFKDEELNKIVIGYDSSKNKNIIAFDLLKGIAREISRHSGYWVKVGYNGNLNIDSLFLAPSRYCRFGKEDDKKFKGKILLYDNWDKELNSDVKKFDKSKIAKFNTFDNKEKNIKYQITGKTEPTELEITSDIQSWSGQIYHQFLDDEFTYPLSPIDQSQHDADTEFQISLFKNGELRRGFFAKYMIAYEKFESKSEEAEFIANMKSFEGASEGGSVMMMEVEGLTTDDQRKPVMPMAIEKIDQNINDKLFKEYETSISNNIRKAFNNLPPILIDYQEGKLSGTSGESIVQAANYYNEQTEFERKTIEVTFRELMNNWQDEKYRNRDWIIKKLEYGSTNNI